MVPLYWSDIWVVTGLVLKVLEGLHNIAARRIAGVTDRSAEEGECEYPPVADAMEASGLWEIKEYVHKGKFSIAEQVVFRTIYELCTGE